MRRQTKLLIVALACIVASIFGIPTFIRAARQRQFDAAQRIVQSHGGDLSFDLVDGNYMLYLRGDAASDATIQALLPTLKELPTTFTLLGPGESRLFWINLENASITDDGLASLCGLHIDWLKLSGGSITDASVSRLSNVDDLKGVILYDVVLSEPAIATLRASKPNATVMVNGDSE